MYDTSMLEKRETGPRGDKPIKAKEALAEAIALEMRRDPMVFLYGQDVQFGMKLPLRPLFEEFGPQRLLNASIAENAMVSVGIGAALTGMRPIIEIMTCDFMLLASDAFFNHAAKYRYLSGGECAVPVTFRIGGTGPGLGHGGQHAQSFEALAMHFPGLKVVYPSNPADAKGLLQSSIRDDNPVMFFEHCKLYPMKGIVPEGDCLVPLGEARVVREGTDVTVVTYGMGVVKTERALPKLVENGISVEVIDLRTLLPLDKETMLASIAKTGRLIIVEEDTKYMGAGAELAAIAADEAFQYLKAPIRRVATLDTCMPGVKATEDLVVPSADDIVAAVIKLLGK